MLDKGELQIGYTHALLISDALQSIQMEAGVMQANSAALSE